MKKILIIDYGLSNLHSVKNAFASCGINAIISSNSIDITDSDVLILPGVGAFEDGMNGLTALGLTTPIKQRVSEGTPLLGICLGMQMLFDESEEFGIHDGLGLIPGRVVKIPSISTDNTPQKVPHISWNPLYIPNGKTSFDGSILANINEGEECYFIHSYEAKPAVHEHCLAETEYGGRRICAVVQNENVLGTQFHPEKSGEVGLRILKQFIEMYC